MQRGLNSCTTAVVAVAAIATHIHFTREREKPIASAAPTITAMKKDSNSNKTHAISPRFDFVCRYELE